MTHTTRRTILRAASLIPLAGLAWGTVAYAQGSPKRSRVVIQVTDNDPARWNLTLNNTRNVQEDLGAANVDIEIVAYGPGINMLKADSVVATRIADAVNAGVKVVACENTMRNSKLTKAEMSTAVGYVPAGVVEIMQKQSEGWAYLRP